jgi:hypothetical protein
MLIFKPVVAIMVSDPINEITKTYYPGEILTFEVRRIGLDGIETITGRFLSYDENRNEIDLDTSVTYGNAITRIKADAIHSVKRQASDIIKDGLAGNVIIPAPVLTPAKKIHEGEDLTKPPTGQDSGKTEPPKTEGGSKTIDEKPTVKLVDGVPIYVDGKKYIPVMALIPDEKVHIASPSPLPDDGKDKKPTPAPDQGTPNVPKPNTETPEPNVPKPSNPDEGKEKKEDPPKTDTPSDPKPNTPNDGKDKEPEKKDEHPKSDTTPKEPEAHEPNNPGKEKETEKTVEPPSQDSGTPKEHENEGIQPKAPDTQKHPESDTGANTQTPTPDHTETPNPQPNNGDEHKKVEGDTNDNNAHSTDNGSTGNVNGGHESGVGPSGDLHNQSGQTESPEKKESTPEQGERTPAGTTEQGGVSGTPAVPPSGVTEENKEHTES